jgi:death-on-curing family protein
MSSPRGPLRFLTTAQVTRLYKNQVTRANPSQPAVLDSAVTSPQNHWHYGQDDVFELARVRAERIILNHAYQDGNKRIALLAADMFLKINGYKLQTRPFAKDAVNDGLKTAHISVATKTWSAEELAEYYRSIATPVSLATAEIEQYAAESEQI